MAYIFLSVPKYYNPYSGNFVRHASFNTHMSYPQTIIPIQLTLLGVHGLSQSFSKAIVLTTDVKVLGMLQHTNPLSLN